MEDMERDNVTSRIAQGAVRHTVVDAYKYQVILIVTSVFLGRIQIVAICDDFAFYMLGDLFGLSALELIVTS